MRATSRNDSRRFSATLVVVIGASVEYDRTSNVTGCGDDDDDLFRAYLVIFDVAGARPLQTGSCFYQHSH